MTQPSGLERERALLTVARALASAEHERDAVQQVLALLCTVFHWRAALCWRVEADSSMLRCVETWPSDDPALADFMLASRERGFAPGEGVPGRVWRTGRTIFIPELLRAANYPRRLNAQAAGLTAAAAFPIVSAAQIVGVIECYAEHAIRHDQDLVDIMEDIGGQLGLFLRRNWAERALRERETQLTGLVDTAGDAIVTMNTAGDLVTINGVGEEMFGWSAAELIGRPLTVLMPERYRESHRVGFARYLTTGRRNIPWRAIPLPGLHRDGSEIPLEISFGEFAHGDERIFTGVMRDISERLRQQKALEDTTAELEQTVDELRERTEQAESASRAKSGFLAATSHELRTPLQAVIGFASLLLEELAGPVNEAQRSQLARIHDAASHLLGLIDQLLDVSRAEAGTLRIAPQRVDLCGEVRDTVAIIGPVAAAKGLHIDVVDCPDPWLRAFVVDPARLRQILLNVLSNAIKFTDRGHITVVTETTDEHVRIGVTDTGIGMKEEQLARVFQPFYQSGAEFAQRGAGLGLGLAISQRLAEGMNGRILVESEFGRGSTFTLELPRNPDSRG